MANKTIYGCYNKTTHKVTFAGEACDSSDYTGCYQKDGAHKGQIAITISEANCNDIYYTCFEPSTGKFELIIPDDCCLLPCEYCVGTTPLSIWVVFDNVNGCDVCYYTQKQTGSIDGTYQVFQDPADNCKWFGWFFGTFGTYTNWVSGCTGDIACTFDCVWMRLTVTRFSTLVRVDADLWDIDKTDPCAPAFPLGFYGTESSITDCCTAVVDNINTDCPEVNEYYGGTATITPAT